jgi:hypothetical protein
MRSLAACLLLGCLCAPGVALAQPPSYRVPRDYEAGVIPAGAVAELIVLLGSGGPTAALRIEEGRQVQIPVGGRVGALDLPQGALLVGKLERLDQGSGYYQFHALIVGNRLYQLSAVSTPVRGRSIADPYALANLKNQRDIARARLGERRGYAQGSATQEFAFAGGGLIGLATGSLRAGLASGLVGTAVGTAQKLAAVNQGSAREEAVLESEIPTILAVDLAPFENLRVRFDTPVDLRRPMAVLPQAVAPNGYPVAPDRPPTPPQAVPNLPVPPPPTYPGGFNGIPRGLPVPGVRIPSFQ